MRRRGSVRIRVVAVLVALALAGVVGWSIAPTSDAPPPSRRRRPPPPPTAPVDEVTAPGTDAAPPVRFDAGPATPNEPAVTPPPALAPGAPPDGVAAPTVEDVVVWSETTLTDFRAVLDAVPDEDLAYAESVVVVAQRAVSRMAFGAQQGDLDPRAGLEAIDRQRKVVVERLAERLQPKELAEVEALLAAPMTGIGEVPRPGGRDP